MDYSHAHRDSDAYKHHNVTYSNISYCHIDWNHADWYTNNYRYDSVWHLHRYDNVWHLHSDYGYSDGHQHIYVDEDVNRHANKSDFDQYYHHSRPRRCVGSKSRQLSSDYNCQC